MINIQEINHRNDLPHVLTKHNMLGMGVEVGTFYGAYANHILLHWLGQLRCVDPYAHADESVWHDGCNRVDLEAVYQAAKADLERNNRCKIIRKPSLEGAKDFKKGSLEFVFLDGNHALEAVVADIDAWYIKVKPGGIFGGHDFYRRNDAETRSNAMDAVLDFGESIGCRPHVTNCTSWWFIRQQ